ncbi:hypothetical protein F5Y08DRAFT_348543 [Xylaria arbuscula]|nr:hypothetical protein F5Y08DRAFT_348543 [Xylaria arbuscula]
MPLPPYPTARSLETENTPFWPSARSPYWQERSYLDLWGQSNGADEPLNGWSLGGTLLGCVFAAVLLAIIIYCAWKYGAPRPSYYETAMKIHERDEKWHRRNSRRYPRPLSQKSSVENWWDAAGSGPSDQLQRPSPARTRSGSSSDDIEQGDLYVEAHKRVASKWSS